MTLIIILSLLLLNITPVEANSDVLYQVLEHVNAERRALGRPALRMDGALSAAAQTRAYEIEGLFSHTRPNGSEWYTIFDQHGIPAGYVGENLAKKSFNVNQSDAHVSSEFFRLWKNSPGHYENMIKAEHTVIGMAVHKSGNVYHMVQLFNSEVVTPVEPKPEVESKPEVTQKPNEEEVKNESQAPSSPNLKKEKPSSTIQESDRIANVEGNGSDQMSIDEETFQSQIKDKDKEIEKLNNKVKELIEVGEAQDTLIDKQLETIEEQKEQIESCNEKTVALALAQQKERRIFLGSIIIMMLLFIIILLRLQVKMKDKGN